MLNSPLPTGYGRSPALMGGYPAPDYQLIMSTYRLILVIGSCRGGIQGIQGRSDVIAHRLKRWIHCSKQRRNRL